jgi:hypothetical protein
MKDILKAVKSGRVTKRKSGKKLRLSAYLPQFRCADFGIGKRRTSCRCWLVYSI